MYNDDSKIKLIIGTGEYLTTATINALIFKKIDRKMTLGDIVEATNYNSNFKVLDICTLALNNYSEIQEFKKLLTDAYEHNIFEFKNIIFDFSNYTRKSVDCILDQLSWIEHFIPKA